MKLLITLLFLLINLNIYSQGNYGTPKANEIPEKLKIYKSGIIVNHFPKEVHPIKNKDTYYWKHNTSILAPESQISIIEYGAYIYYNNQWNLRKVYPLKGFDKLFGTKKLKLNQGEPYTWTDNWRTGQDLFAGWALWYFIGKTTSGKLICGYQTIYTSNKLLN